MDVKSDLKQLIREHIEHQLAFKRKSIEKIPSFYKLTKEDQEKLIAHELQSPDGYDMIDNHDGPSIMQLLFDCIVLKKISKEQVVNSLLESIIQRYASNIDEMFDAEFERYLNEQNENIDYQHQKCSESELLLMESRRDSGVSRL
jgi:hypothetical protein